MSLLVLLYAVFWLNDFAFVQLQHSYLYTVLLDYALRVFVLWRLLASPAAREAILAAWEPTPLWPTLGWVATIFAVSRVAEFLEPAFEAVAPGLGFVGFPWSGVPAAHAVDLTLGLALVAASEELLGRVWFRQVVEPLVPNRALFVVLSAAVFALAHWSQGTGGIASTFIVGTALMLAYLRLGSIGPCIVAHYLANLAIFW